MPGPTERLPRDWELPDIPVCSKAYRVVIHNYLYWQVMSEVWGHSLEYQFLTVDKDLFEEFRGPLLPMADPSNPLIGRCGTIHNPPNARVEYDRANAAPNLSDCRDWQPGSLGTLSPVSCADWSCTGTTPFDVPEATWSTWYWQNVPGRNNSTYFGAEKLRNWWDVLGRYDELVRRGEALSVAPTPTPSLVHILGAQLRFEAASFSENTVTVTQQTATQFAVTDSTHPVTPGSGCSAVDANTVSCTGAVASIGVFAGDGADSVSVDATIPALLDGGAGNDVLVGGAGNDILIGGPGADVFDGGAGADEFQGGPGEDTVTYASRSEDVVVSVGGDQPDDGSAFDGPPGARDNVRGDVDVVIGGSGDDTLSSSIPIRLVGERGNDTLIGSAFGDRLEGGRNADTLLGGGGDDILDGGRGVDTISGGDGVDTVTYAERSGAASVTLDGIANDGESGEGDNVSSDVEKYPTVSAVRMVYVDPLTGSDVRSRKQAASPTTPWRTLAHATANVQMGDTIQLGVGTYAERVRITIPGITLRGTGPLTQIAPGSLDGILVKAPGATIRDLSVVGGRHGILAAGQVDGLHVRNVAIVSPSKSGIVLRNGRDVLIERSIVTGSRLVGVRASKSRLSMRDALIYANGRDGFVLVNSDGDVRLSTIHANTNRGIALTNSPIVVKDAIISGHLMGITRTGTQPVAVDYTCLWQNTAVDSRSSPEI